jgi:hypothetical protein
MCEPVGALRDQIPERFDFFTSTVFRVTVIGVVCLVVPSEARLEQIIGNHLI